MVEWIGLTLAAGVGLDVPAHALVLMPDGMHPALVVERFDIRRSPQGATMLAMEDMCSILDLAPKDKYTGTIERIARAIRPLSTDAEGDLHLLLKRALLTWLIADGDMHLKNMAILKSAQPGESSFSSVRLAPVYDTLTTRVFPRLEHDHMALKLNGKDERLRRADFVALAALAGLGAAEVNDTLDEVLQALHKSLDRLEFPAAGLAQPNAQAVVTKVLGICRERLQAFD